MPAAAKTNGCSIFALTDSLQSCEEIPMESHIIIIGEHAEGHIAPVTFELIAFAQMLQKETHAGIHLLLAGHHLGDAATRLAETWGIDVTLLEPDKAEMATRTGFAAPDDLIFKNLPIDLLDRLNPIYVCAGHTPNGADAAPALAISLNAACITGIERVASRNNALSFVRSVFNDKITATILPTAKTTVLTMMPGNFKTEPPRHCGSGTVSVVNVSVDKKNYAFHGFKKNSADTSALENADVIVSAGNGIKKQEDLEHIYQLSRLFPKSAVAGSRPVCDKKWLKYSQQVGVTGATVKSKLYIACGISGASQHVAGMRDSRFIVAINTDPHAAIFNSADVCIIEDLTTFIPRLISTYHETF
ncbi:MAG: electron transfer flavoprotein subunit alpha/FixB family protein [Desulfobacteraceae bacterium]|nr:MAG: electron transfer flavoprotein subunit alpha/FixB family protein [Desulfobacteraceae bacterium]